MLPEAALSLAGLVVHTSEAGHPGVDSNLQRCGIPTTTDIHLATVFVVRDVAKPPNEILWESRLRGCILATGVDAGGFAVPPWLQHRAAVATPRTVWMSAAFQQHNPKLARAARASDTWGGVAAMVAPLQSIYLQAWLVNPNALGCCTPRDAA